MPVRTQTSAGVMSWVLMGFMAPVLGAELSGKVVDGATGDPIEGVKIRVREEGEGERRLGRGETAADGQYSISDLPSEEALSATFRKRGYLPPKIEESFSIAGDSHELNAEMYEETEDEDYILAWARAVTRRVEAGGSSWPEEFARLGVILSERGKRRLMGRALLGLNPGLELPSEWQELGDAAEAQEACARAYARQALVSAQGLGRPSLTPVAGLRFKVRGTLSVTLPESRGRPVERYYECIVEWDGEQWEVEFVEVP